MHGRNGSGKTTLLRTLYGDHGVAVGGIDCARRASRPGVPLEVFKKRVGLVAPHLQADYPRRATVAEVVQSGRHASIGLQRGAERRRTGSAARRALAHFRADAARDAAAAQLSYGQVRAVCCSRAPGCARRACCCSMSRLRESIRRRGAG